MDVEALKNKAFRDNAKLWLSDLNLEHVVSMGSGFFVPSNAPDGASGSSLQKKQPGLLKAGLRGEEDPKENYSGHKGIRSRGESWQQETQIPRYRLSSFPESAAIFSSSIPVIRP